MSDKFALSQDEFDQIQAKDPDVDLLKVGIKGIGVVVLKPPSRGDVTRFTKKMERGTDTSEAKEELARSCVAWPRLEELDTEIDKRRKYGAWLGLANEAAKLSGIVLDDIEGN